MTQQGATLSLDYSGQHGGQLAMAFGAGWAACFTICTALGAFLWSILGKAKDARIAELEGTIEEDRERCALMEARLVQRIQQLEGFVLAMSPGHLRQEIQQAISEQRVMEDAAHGGKHEAGR